MKVGSAAKSFCASFHGFCLNSEDRAYSTTKLYYCCKWIFVEKSKFIAFKMSIICLKIVHAVLWRHMFTTYCQQVDQVLFQKVFQSLVQFQSHKLCPTGRRFGSPAVALWAGLLGGATGSTLVHTGTIIVYMATGSQGLITQSWFIINIWFNGPYVCIGCTLYHAGEGIFLSIVILIQKTVQYTIHVIEFTNKQEAQRATYRAPE